MPARRIIPSLATLLVLGLGALTVWVVDRSEHERAVATERSLVMARLAGLRARVEGELHQSLLLVAALESVVAQDPEITPEEFAAVARRLIDEDDAIRSLQLARGGVVTHLYPLAGNEPALGLSLLDHPVQGPTARRTVEERRAVVAGPTALVQGGEAFITRAPIFLPDPARGEERFWGFASVLVDTSEFFEGARLTRAHEPTASGPGVAVALSGQDGRGATGAPFFGDAQVLTQDPVVLEVSLPSGTWQLAGIPVRGSWQVVNGTEGLRVVGALLVLVLALAAFAFASNVLRLREELRAHWEAELRLREQTRDLEKALAEVKTLTGLLPICSHCKQIRDDRGLWLRIERYIEDHSDATFTHGLCPACVEELYGSDIAATVARKIADTASK